MHILTIRIKSSCEDTLIIQIIKHQKASMDTMDCKMIHLFDVDVKIMTMQDTSVLRMLLACVKRQTRFGPCRAWHEEK